jgi:hypothetical protein
MSKIKISAKDRTRIEDIVSKSNGDSDKESQLATTMCKLITTESKALGRYLVAKEMKMNHLADIFLDRAKELGATGAQEWRKYVIEGLG